MDLKKGCWYTVDNVKNLLQVTDDDGLFDLMEYIADQEEEGYEVKVWDELGLALAALSPFTEEEVEIIHNRYDVILMYGVKYAHILVAEPTDMSTKSV
jgi:hypothetical protein